jgi:hypothetical protein
MYITRELALRFVWFMTSEGHHRSRPVLERCLNLFLNSWSADQESSHRPDRIIVGTPSTRSMQCLTRTRSGGGFDGIKHSMLCGRVDEVWRQQNLFTWPLQSLCFPAPMLDRACELSEQLFCAKCLLPGASSCP